SPAMTDQVRCCFPSFTLMAPLALRDSNRAPTCGKQHARRVEALMAQQQLKSHRLDNVDPVWKRIRDEAEEVARREPELASFIYSSILHHDAFEQAVVHRIAERLDHPDVSGELIRQAYADALEDDPSIGDAFRTDIMATVDRHPKIRRGVMVWAGAKIFGTIEVRHCSRVAAGSVVLKPVPPNTTVAGVPAKEVGTARCAEPARAMDQMLYDLGP